MDSDHDADAHDGKVFATFEKAPQFLEVLGRLLSLDLATEPTSEEDQQEQRMTWSLQLILHEYQEQSYLLDPFLEQMVMPVVEVFKRHAKNVVKEPQKTWSRTRSWRLHSLVYMFIGCRGYKTIVRFFPHEVSDLPIPIAYLLMTRDQSGTWQLGYILLLWLSLICMIPFDLSRFDAGNTPGTKTLDELQNAGKAYLDSAGLEREGAAILLARLYIRKDAYSEFPPFLAWSADRMRNEPDIFKGLGVLRVLCEYAKLCSAEQLLPYIPAIGEICSLVDRMPAYSGNTIARKLKTKLISRVALKLLPPARSARQKARALMATDNETSVDPVVAMDFEVPESVEATVGEVLQLLEDKDTTVRWSASKALSRISERLPTDFADQVVDSVLDLFSVHSLSTGDETLDLPATAEQTWHGACLACAEFARRGLLNPEKLQLAMPYITKALQFDIRKGAHSVGSNVRDAAAYVVWSLARTQDPDVLKPFADDLARQLVVASLYDREVHIRRAASAAFQENVGRMGLFPHGIAVLAKIDFYAIGIRRNSFVVAAAQVAEYVEYQDVLIDHLLRTTLSHWDLSMRQRGAQSLRAVCERDIYRLGPEAVRRAAAGLTSVDANRTHGTLLALAELAASYRELTTPAADAKRLEIYRCLALLPERVFQIRQHDLILEGSCLLIAQAVSPAALQDAAVAPRRRKILDDSMRHRTPAVQEAAAFAIARTSEISGCAQDVERYAHCFLLRRMEFAGGLPLMQQSVARTLGMLAYDKHPHGVVPATLCLLGGVERSSGSFSGNVEARQKCYEALPSILNRLGPKLVEEIEPALFQRIYQAFTDGLDDYTTDERGDVGSWIRMASIRALCSASKLLFSLDLESERLQERLTTDTYVRAISGMLKQGVERLDNVRQHAGEQLCALFASPHPQGWAPPGLALFTSLFLSAPEEDSTGWNDAKLLFPKAAQLLAIPAYRVSLVHGFVLSIGSRTDSTNRPAASALTEFANALPVTAAGDAEALSLAALVREIVALASDNFVSNHIVIPVLQTLDALIEAEVLAKLALEGLETLNAVLSLATKGADRMKNVQRIHSAMKIVTGLAIHSSVADRAIAALPVFLAHRFPKIRSDTAEALYVALQAQDITNDRVDEILLETDWASDIDAKGLADELVALLQ